MKQILTASLAALIVSCNSASSKEDMQREYDSIVLKFSHNDTILKTLKGMEDVPYTSLDLKLRMTRYIDSLTFLQNSLETKRIELAKKLFQKE